MAASAGQWGNLLLCPGGRAAPRGRVVGPGPLLCAACCMDGPDVGSNATQGRPWNARLRTCGQPGPVLGDRLQKDGEKWRPRKRAEAQCSGNSGGPAEQTAARPSGRELWLLMRGANLMMHGPWPGRRPMG
ncbi:hypothetical protein NDU88_004209 [Pleurodeles waltl]|uniref:Uncharacterized protein n=1 Tax=Pleurodeles waltl TaxID=8319 RepID=A0AAV7TRA0_PLEWA|nr:hypothetical protein NDU88_004209 [Pleurodeles waltl]